jgi:cell division septal protein FtsQ
MENIEKDLLKERKIVHQERKYLRVKPVIWIRKYLWIVILVSTLVITGILGFYNIKDIVYSEKESSHVKEGTLRSLIDEYMNKNFFLVNPENVEEKILTDPYIKTVEVEKIFPDKLEIDIEEYIPLIAMETEDAKCKIFSQEGNLLETREETECENLTEEDGIIYFTGESTQVVEEEGEEYFYLTDDIYNIEKILNEYDVSIVSAELEENILNVSTDSNMIVSLDTGQDLKTQLARLLVVLKELESLNIKAQSIDVRFERPVLVIDK